jgi:hypothetical protein
MLTKKAIPAVGTTNDLTVNRCLIWCTGNLAAFSLVFTSYDKVGICCKEAYPYGWQTAQPKDEEANPVPSVCSVSFWHAIRHCLPAAPNAPYHEIDTGA